MEAKKKRAKVIAGVLALVGLLLLSLSGRAGNLEPSASPAPTMKTLDEVEPRIPIHASDLPLTITKPNSYYFVEDVNFNDDANDAITVEAADVTIDLMGYQLIGPGSGTGYGIYVYWPSNNLEIRNGTVRDFYSGIYVASGGGHRFINIRAISNGQDGIAFGGGNGALVKDCTAADNGRDGLGPSTYYCTVTGNTVYNNGRHGIYTHYYCTVTGNTCYNNDSDGIYVVGGGCTVTGNNVTKNSGDGIRVSGSCRVSDNTCKTNGDGGDGAGIHATGSDNHIQRNNITGNDRGIDVDAGGNVIADNMVKANTDNYDIDAGNQINILLCEIPETIDWPATVTLAGSLTLDANDVDGITVDSNDVTIDLAGFSLIGPGSGNGYGIYMNGRSNVEIRNGIVRDFGADGIREASDNSGRNHRIINVRVMLNGHDGIQLDGHAHLVKDCTAGQNGHSGIHASTGSTVTGNTCYSNGGHGITPGSGCTITGNTCHSNDDNGISADSGCTITGNTCYSNGDHGITARSGSTITGNTINYNDKAGFITNSYACAVIGNTVRGNNQMDSSTLAGIWVYWDCLVKGNTVTYNLQNNIYIKGYCNAIEENLVTHSSGYGIYFYTPLNFYANNRASENVTNYGNTAGNTDGGGNWSF